MSVWNFTSNATGIGFTTAGLTGDGGMWPMKGSAYFPMYVGASFYANGSYRFVMSSTRGLINYVNIGTANASSTAKTLATSNATSVCLSTQGVTGTFTADILHPESFHTFFTNSSCSAPKFTRVEIRIRNGIIYGWRDWDGYQEQNSGGYVYPLTLTSGVDMTGPSGVGLVENSTSLRIVSGISGTLTYYGAYDVTFYQGYYFWQWYVSVLYYKMDIVLSSGLLQSFNRTAGELYYYCGE